MTTLSKEDVVRTDNDLLAMIQKHFPSLPLDDRYTDWGKWLRFAKAVYSHGEQAARADLVAENERLRGHFVEERNRTLSLCNEVAQLIDQTTATRTALAAAEARERNYISALKYHADVNCSNILAYDLRDKALAQPRDDSALREMIAGVYEECEQACAEVISRRRENGNTIGFNAMSECKDAIRALAEKAKGE